MEKESKKKKKLVGIRPKQNKKNSVGDKTKTKGRKKGRKIKRKRGEETSIEEKWGRKEKVDFPGVPMVREEKLIHASQATRGYQYLGVSSNSTR